ncbi:hypothetical protein [Pseudanabaena minima]|uniref:hypothetical protein n=1 Tax=Pseudanabaena minima TaxID=890415 RepID=UPI003DA94E0D
MALKLGSLLIPRLIHTALCSQNQTKKIFESVALQRFQKFSCGSFDSVMAVSYFKLVLNQLNNLV